ncbi:Heterokaryon incompatibility protein (HET) domain containing protein, partial [Hyaloscypha variabilis]
MWLQKCLQEHRESCPRNPATALLPSRVIDVGPAEGFQAPYIHVSKANETGEWAILSHCWGQKIGYVTTSANLHSGLGSLQHDALPATINDAIKITRDMGLRYLWVDSICIVQGSDIEAHADWMVESSRMRDYYKNSVVCIAIDDAASDEEGFLGHTRPAEVRIPVSTQYCPQDTDAPSTLYIGTDIAHWTSMMDYRPILSSRGWTLQEEVLTPRTLHFTAKQLVWECQRHQSYESNMTAQSWPMNDSFHEMPKRYFLVPDFGRNYILSSDYPFIAKVLDPGDRWISMVINYTKRSLTVQSDRLVAIGGLAQELQAQSGYNYCAGIWAEDIHRGLLWRLYGLGQTPKSYIAPSWSWAAL